jgi:hypothetical protein
VTEVNAATSSPIPELSMYETSPRLRRILDFPAFRSSEILSPILDEMRKEAKSDTFLKRGDLSAIYSESGKASQNP